MPWRWRSAAAATPAWCATARSRARSPPSSTCRGHPAGRDPRRERPCDDRRVILRRVQFADGRTRAFINDQPVSVQTLSGRRALVEIHGQHETAPCSMPPRIGALLDAFGGLGARRRLRWRRWRRGARQTARSRAHRAGDRARRSRSGLAAPCCPTSSTGSRRTRARRPRSPTAAR